MTGRDEMTDEPNPEPTFYLREYEAEYDMDDEDYTAAMLRISVSGYLYSAFVDSAGVTLNISESIAYKLRQFDLDDDDLREAALAYHDRMNTAMTYDPWDRTDHE